MKEEKLYKPKKTEKNLLISFVKVVAVLFLIFAQIGLMLVLLTTAQGIYRYARLIFDLLKIITVLYLLYRHDSAAYKISWILFILFFPAAGIVAYYLWGNSKLRFKKELQYRTVRIKTEKELKDSQSIEKELLKQAPYQYKQVQYMTKITGYPIYQNQGVEYFRLGENFFEDVKQKLKEAKHYILIEFYILAKGKLWDEISQILIQKAKEGVEVVITIDALGCLLKKPKNFIDDMASYGIRVYKFNPLSYLISGYFNYRNHRKIVVVDGVYAYTGGINLADEYVNKIEKFGHWKDCGIRIEGKSVFSYTLMVLRNLEVITRQNIDYERYKKIGEEEYTKIKKSMIDHKGYVLSYADGPDNRKNPVENIYIQMLNYAKNYVYITTPYFVPSETMLNAILNSARSGIDVRIILPHIPDKKFVQMSTRSFYEVLLEAGVRVYEYAPGFIHSKTFVVDDTSAIVGSANIDFRSSSLNFECATWIYQTGEEKAIRIDFEEMVGKCIEIDLEKWKKRPFIKRATEALLSAFSPML